MFSEKPLLMAFSPICNQGIAAKSAGVTHQYENETPSHHFRVLSERRRSKRHRNVGFAQFPLVRLATAELTLPDIAPQTNVRSGPCAMQSFPDLFRGDHHHGLGG
jgi:hypothetical protein